MGLLRRYPIHFEEELMISRRLFETITAMTDDCHIKEMAESVEASIKARRDIVEGIEQELEEQELWLEDFIEELKLR